MIKLLLDIKHRCPWIWDAIERLNGCLFRLRSRKPESVASALPAKVPEGFRFLPVEAADIPDLSRFLSSQPEERLQYFRPHNFDEKSLRKRFDNPSFLMMKVREETSGRLAGYFFLRFFFVGAAVAGLIVAEEYTNQGVGRSIWAYCMDICRQMRFRMFATISNRNVPSLKSCRYGTRMRIVKTMPDDYMLVECKTK